VKVEVAAIVVVKVAEIVIAVVENAVAELALIVPVG